MRVLVGVEGALEVLVRLRQVLDPHVGAQGAVVGRTRAQFVVGQPAPAVDVEPPLRRDDEGAQHIAHVVVADVEAVVHPVDPADGRTSRVTVEAVLDDRVQEQRGVVVPLLRTVRQLGGLRKQPADGRDGIGAVQGQFEGACDVPGELVRRCDPVDFQEVPLRIEVLDVLQPVVTPHRTVPLVQVECPSVRAGAGR